MDKSIDIAIVGAGAIYPGAHNANEFWSQIVRGTDLITNVPLSHWNADDYYDKNPKAKNKFYCKRGGFIPDIEFDPLEWGVPPQNLPATDTSQLLALVVAKQLLNDVFQGKFLGTDFSRTSIFLGITCALPLLGQMSGKIYRPIWEKAMREAGLEELRITEICERISQYFPEWQENTFPGLLPNVVAGRIANRLNLGGTNCTLDAACASSFAALHQGINELRLHQSDMTIVGGVDVLNEPIAFYCFSKTPALSPTEDCRPFSDKSDGTLISEGLGLFALKRLEDAERDGNKIYALIRGIGTSSDGRAKSIYAPVAKGQEVASQRAYEMAGYSPATVDLLEAHGTGTKAGDIEEFNSSKSVYESADNYRKQWCALGTIKSQIGHTKGAAGAAGLFKITMALHHKILPPTIKVDQPNAELDINNSPFYLNTIARPWIKNNDEIRRASVSSFGFGGTNFHVTVEEYKGKGKKPSCIITSKQQLILFSAVNKDQLIKQCEDAIDELTKYGNDVIPCLARSSYQSFRTQDQCRLAVMVSDEIDASNKLSDIISNLKSENDLSINKNDIYATNKSLSGKLAFIFSGQGSQYINMSSDLAMMFNSAREIWDSTTGIKLDIYQPLHEVVFPKPAFTDDEKRKQQDLLNNTIWTQPALAAVAYSQLALLNDLGIKADCVAGHSFGELVALAYAGAFDFLTLIQLARKRGELMSDSSGGEKGGMLAVIHPIEKIPNILTENKITLTPANYNGPSEMVLSGSIEEIENAKQIFDKYKIRYKQLNVSNAFHSSVMKSASIHFREVIDKLSFGKLSTAVYANMTAKKYEDENVKDIISDSLVNPVRFVEMIEAMYADGVRLFVEVGPSSILSNLVKSILHDKDVQVISMDQKNENGVIAFWRAIGKLVVNGVAMDFNRLLSDFDIPVIPESKESKKKKILINGSNIRADVPELKKPPQQQINSVIANEVKIKDEPVVQQPSLIEPYIELQKSIASAHEFYQKTTAESHQAFLSLAEKTLHSLNCNKMPDQPLKKDDLPILVASKTEIPSESKNENTPQDDLVSSIISIIASETGYPVDMLKMEMDMEADLGIDSIKRVEIISVIKQSIMNLPDLDPMELANIKTVQQLNDYVAVKISSNQSSALIQTGKKKLNETQFNIDQRNNLVRKSQRMSNKPYSNEMLPRLDHGKTIVIKDKMKVSKHLVDILSKNGIQAQEIDSISKLPERYSCVIYIDGLQRFESIEAAINLNYDAFKVAKTVAKSFSEQPGTLVLVQHTRGDFGLSGESGLQAWSSGLVGLARTLSLEWKKSFIKTIDIEDIDLTPEEIAKRLADELLLGGHDKEIGLRKDGSRMQPENIDMSYQPDDSFPLEDNSIVLVSGGARGITAWCVEALASRHRLQFILLGRTKMEDEPDYCRHLNTVSELKKAIYDYAKHQNLKLSPNVLDHQVNTIVANREIRTTLEKINQSASSAIYYSVDVNDAQHLSQVISEIVLKYGKIDGLIHGAGVIQDHLIEQKSEKEFDFVFSTKVRGLSALLTALDKQSLRHIFIFSSRVAHDGNQGQTDYAMANQVMNAVSTLEQYKRGVNCRVKCVEWNPWKGSSMVTPPVQAILQQRGYDVLDKDSGTKLFIDELSQSNPIIIHFREHKIHEFSEQMSEKADKYTIEPDKYSFLSSHCIKGKPVIPVCLALEWFMRSIKNVYPDVKLYARDLKVLHGIRLENLNNQNFTVLLHPANENQPSSILMELRSNQNIPCYQMTSTISSDFINKKSNSHVVIDEEMSKWPWSIDQCYGDPSRLFHGPDFQVIKSLDEYGDHTATATLIGSQYLNWPRDNWFTDPGIIDGAFQVASLFGQAYFNKVMLPMKIKEFSIYEEGLSSTPVKCIVQLVSHNPYQANYNITISNNDKCIVEINGLEMIVIP